MSVARALIVLLSLVSAALPILGLIGLYRSATRDLMEASGGQPNKDPLQWPVGPGVTRMLNGVRERPKEARRDIFLIGSGILVGAAANIWSLFL